MKIITTITFLISIFFFSKWVYHQIPFTRYDEKITHCSYSSIFCSENILDSVYEKDNYVYCQDDMCYIKTKVTYYK